MMDDRNAAGDREALLYLKGPALCCATAAAVLAVMTSSAWLALLGAGFGVAAFLLAPAWMRLPRRARGLSSLWAVLGAFCLSCAALLPVAVQRTSWGVIIPGRPALLAAGAALLAAGLIAGLAAPADRR